MAALQGAVLLATVLAQSAAAGDSARIFSRTLGGSTGTTTINAVATDSSGNVIVAGTTAAFDFPVTNGSVNSGTAIAESFDSGKTWKPRGSLPGNSTYVLARDASTPPLLFAGGGGGVFRSADSGKTWTLSAGPAQLNCGSPFCGLNAVTADPVRPGIVYAGGNFGIMKTIDGGTTWKRAQSGITVPTGPGISFLAIDPFHPNVVYTEAGPVEFRSSDGGNSWSQYSVPNSNPGISFLSHVAFDPLTPGRIYYSGAGCLCTSSDGGQTWTRAPGLDTPIEGVGASPTSAGVAFALDLTGRFYRTTDGGANWSLMSMLGNNSYGPIVVDPFQPLHVFAGPESLDGGVTWSQSSLSRTVTQMLFDPSLPGQVWASAIPTIDGFVAKLDPSGQQILFATYFGGGGDDWVLKTGLDAAGNIYVFGITNSRDFPITPGAAESTPSHPNITSGFVARFDSAGRLVYSTYLDADGEGFAVSPDGSAVVAGYRCHVEKLSPDGSTLVFSEALGGDTTMCPAVAVNRDGTILVAGRDASAKFHVTSDALQPVQAGSQDAVLAALDAAGNLLYATYLGGTQINGPSFTGTGTSQITAATFDEQGNMVVTGSTAANFPVTAGAFQSSLQAHCPYPSSVSSGGFFGTLVATRMDDAFVTRLDPTGTSILSSTLLGGACYDEADSIGVDAAGNVWLAGTTNSSPFPQVVPFASGPAYPQYKAFVAEFNAGGDTLLLSSYLDAGNSAAIATNQAGGAWVGGADGLTRIGSLPANPLTITGVGNSFTGRNGPLSAGEFATITLTGFQPDQATNLGLNAPLPSSLDGAQVLFDGEPAALVAVDSNVIVCLTPYGLASKTSTVVQVRFGDQVSTALTVSVQPTDVGLLAADYSGHGQAFVRNADGSLNSPDNPAPAGSQITLYVTGVGLADATCPYGQIAPGGFVPSITLITSAGGHYPVAALPGFVCGIFSFQVTVPNQPGAGPNQPFSVEGYTPSTPTEFAAYSQSQMLTIAVTPQ